MQEHIKYMRTTLQEKIKDPTFLRDQRTSYSPRTEHPELLVADFWEQIGVMAKYGMVDEDALMDIVSAQIMRAWQDLEPVVMAGRERAGPSAFENFEYLAVRAHQWTARHPSGAYPPNLPRMAQIKASRERETSSG
ncbi:MAG: DUF4760 domain-containing protein [Candidatus Eremiobacteraeota bacterium]|nr:DUF4760 domain-containing protein [Candidatus Eremiobacteraeota bacterium]